MVKISTLAITAVLAILPADMAAARDRSVEQDELPAYLQCVPYARQISGIQIFGDAYTWWEQAAGRFRRGARPKVGAVMAFRPFRNMELGHVAAVSKVIDSRTVLLDHANWSPIDGRRGQIERGVKAVDVSPGNDWSQVRVWYDPIQALGTTAWPVAGFIYGEKAGKAERQRAAMRLAAITPEAPARQAMAAPVRSAPVQAAPMQAAPVQAAARTPSRAFLSAFPGGRVVADARAPQVQPAAAAPGAASMRTAAAARVEPPRRLAQRTPPRMARSGISRDIVRMTIAKYE